MSPTIAELLRALPEESETFAEEDSGRTLEPTLQPVPVGRWRRLGLLGSLQARIAVAYLFYWIRGWFRNADQKEVLLAESNWKVAIRLLDSMGYMRGTVMKLGQTLANYPDIVPQEFVQTLEQLHFSAPPMHWFLLREMVYNELGDDPENLFARFEQRAFAAASLGQVHRARLKTGEEVAVKIQYPGIARAVREDCRNLSLLIFPGRLNREWEYAREQCHDLCTRLERETDYLMEAAAQEMIRHLFHEDDGIVIPRVYADYSTSRVLTMERLEGVHLDEFLARNPSEEERNQYAMKIIRTWCRMLYSGRITYADMHPGNFLFMDDGRLGVLDFGFLVAHGDEEWQIMRKIETAMTTGRREDRVVALKEWSHITEDPEDADRLRLHDAMADWLWRPRYCGGPFDFGDEAEFRRGVDFFIEMLRKRYAKARPNTLAITRLNFSVRAMLYRLKARIDIRPIAEEEVRATGWDRTAIA